MSDKIFHGLLGRTHFIQHPDWNQKGRVLKWDIKKFIHQDKVVVVEWYFECEFENRIDGFDGVSIVEFDVNSKII